MTKLHLTRRSSRRVSVPGLILSLALIFSASGIMGIDAVEHESPCIHAEETAGSPPIDERADALTVSPAVHEQGHREGLRNL